MSKTSSVVKDRWNAKNYDTVTVRIPKGQKAVLKELCEKSGVSMNSVFADAAQNFIDERS